MSRLDYITIAIVAACILAIIFLVYKMTDLFNEEPTTDNIENTEPKKVEEDSSYVYNIEDDTLTDEAGENVSDDTTPADEGTSDDSQPPSTADDYEIDDEEEEPATTPVTRPVASGNSGKFMVIAGTFSQKINAKKQLQQLKKLGYNNATIEPFDRGKYDVVLVDRFDNMASAERLINDLKEEGISSYVKLKESN